MTSNANQFAGSIPEHYDRGLGPNVFPDYADDLARRAAEGNARDVLEMAAGTGIVTRRLHDALAPGTRLVATDLSPAMLEVARTKFRDGEAVTFQPADAMALPFADASFDLIVCQFGVMFFPDKPASFREAARVLRPGGRYIFNSWGSMAENPFSEIGHEIAAQFFPDNPPGFYRIPFSYPDAAQVTADLAAAGWSAVAHEVVEFRKTVADAAGFARGLVYGNPLIDEIRQRGTADPETVTAAVHQALLTRFGAEPFTMPLKATVYTCTR